MACWKSKAGCEVIPEPMERLFTEIDSDEWCLDGPTQLPFYADNAAAWFRTKYPNANESELHAFLLKLGSRIGRDVSKYDHASQNKSVTDTQIRWAIQDEPTKTAAAKKLGITRQALNRRLNKMPRVEPPPSSGTTP